MTIKDAWKRYKWWLLGAILFDAGMTAGGVLYCNKLVVDNAEGRLYSDIDKVPEREVGLLLGTSPLSRFGNPNNLFFINRITAAEELYKKGKVHTILISGSDGMLHEVNEVESMRDSLIERGVPASRIVLDGKGYRTLHSVVRARNVYGVKSMIIISQHFHNERALFQIDNMGIDAEGTVCVDAKDSESKVAFITHLREYAARVKMMWDLYVNNEEELAEISQEGETLNLSNVRAKMPERDMLKDKPYSVEYDGVDVSHFQNNIKWDELKKDDSLKFVYARVMGMNERIDELYYRNMSEAKRCGVLIGTYHFFTMDMSVQDQWRKFRRFVDKDKQDLKPMIDIESQSLSATDNTHLKDSVMWMAKAMEAEYGVKPVIYSNQNFYEQYLTPEFDDYPLWIANYSRMPRLQTGVPFLWQFSCTGHVRGIWCEVDLNRFVNGGSMDDLLLKK